MIGHLCEDEEFELLSLPFAFFFFLTSSTKYNALRVVQESEHVSLHLNDATSHDGWLWPFGTTKHFGILNVVGRHA